MCLRGLVRICVTESLQRSPPSPSRGLGGFFLLIIGLFQTICNKDIPSRGLGRPSFYLSLGCFKLYAIRTSPPRATLSLGRGAGGEAWAWGGYSFYLFSASIAFIFCFTSFISSLSFSIRRFISSMRLLPFLELILKKPRLFS